MCADVWFPFSCFHIELSKQRKKESNHTKALMAAAVMRLLHLDTLQLPSLAYLDLWTWTHHSHHLMYAPILCI